MTAPFLPPLTTTADMTPINAVMSVAPTNGTALPNGTARGFMVNVAGNIAITDANGQTNTLAVLAGTIYWIRLTQVQATGTTATGIFALY